MKSFLFSAFVVALFLLAPDLKAQYSLQTAKYSSFNCFNGAPSFVDSLPPLTSLLPAGPYYGSMNVTQRPLWYYYPSCISVSSSKISYSVFPLFSLANISGAIWGPFDSISGITLAQLDSSKLLGSYNKSITSGSGFFTPDLPHIDTGKVYIIVATCDDTLSNLQMAASMILTPNNPFSPSSAYTDVCNLCNGKATYFEEYKGICSLSVDTPGNYPHLVWNKNVADFGIYGYYIERMNAIGTFDTLAFISYQNRLSEFIDTSVNAVQQKRTYGIIPVDSCNQTENSLIAYSYSTIYLQSYPGLNNEVNLTWDYSGLHFYSQPVIPVAYIWRSSNGNPPVLIDSVWMSGFMPCISYYTDINAPSGPVKYTIEVRNSAACNAMKMPGSYPSILSNLSGVMVLGVDDLNELSFANVRPNPITDNIISLDFGIPLRSDAVLTLFSVEGRKIEQANVSIGSDHYSWLLQHINPGIYQLSIESSGFRKNIKLVSY